MGVEDSVRVAQAFIDEFNNRAEDPDLYTDDAVLWNNITEVEHRRADGGGSSKILTDALPDLRFDDVVVRAWDGGFAVQYEVRATLPEGGELRAPACGVGVVVSGRLARFQEYVDSGQCAALSAILLEAMGQAG